jgi:hypothetical protein
MANGSYQPGDIGGITLGDQEEGSYLGINSANSLSSS